MNIMSQEEDIVGEKYWQMIEPFWEFISIYEGPSTTVVDSGVVWHHAPEEEGGLDVPYGGPEDGEIVD